MGAPAPAVSRSEDKALGRALIPLADAIRPPRRPSWKNKFSLESLEIQMTEVLDRPASATKPKRLGRHRRNTLLRSSRRTRSDRPSEPVSITDLNLTAEQYNDMLARAIPTLQPVGM